ncbi:restriction endonuclease subunit S domain-containing protein [Methanobrevibacter wolinii]|uniref:restriction endonuclease subunit S n=1 Tax=Methanobrevibacter wolinii TaxID=190977 RepID=UPI00069346C6|nr:restriction endonuclease subunit S [Methanobrevibacter wolinii]
MPKLRFRKFKDEWRKVSLKDITIRIKDKNKSLETDLPLTISAQYGLIDQREYFNKIVASKSLANYYLLKKGDFAYNKSYSTGYPYGTIKRLNKYDKGAVSTLYICFKPKNIDSNFLEQYFETDKWYKEIYKIAVEGARNHGLLNIAISDFFNTKHYIPKSKDEQIKISKFLEIVDEKIDLLEKKYRNQIKFSKELRNKFLNKHCFFNDNWVEHDIKEYVVEYKEKVNFNNNLPILSSTLSGIYLQEDYFNKNVNSSDVSNYKIVPKNYFTYRSMSDTGKFKFNIQNIVEKGIISPAYPVFTTKNINDKYIYMNF